MDPIGFRAMTRADLPRMHAWLNEPHVAKWWGGPRSFADVEREYVDYMTGLEPIRPYIVLHGGDPIGHIQWMRYSDYPDYARILGIDDLTSANCDVFLGERSMLHRGIGSPMIRRFVHEVIFAEDVTSCFIDPEQGNHAAIRAYEKAGFSFVRDIDDDGQGGTVHLMEMRRP